MKPLTRRFSQLTEIAICIFALFGVALATSCADGADSFTYHYKLTIEINDNGHRTSAFNVVEVRTRLDPPGGSVLPSVGPSVHNNVTGEALVIPLQSGRPLIATLKAYDWNMPQERDPQYRSPRLWGEDTPYEVLKQAYGITTPPEARGQEDYLLPYRENLARLIAQRGPQEIPLTYLPDLVTFGDPSNPATVQLIDPANPSVALGPGIRIVRATIEITEEPITRGIERWLPWASSWVETFSERGEPGSGMNALWLEMERGQ